MVLGDVHADGPRDPWTWELVDFLDQASARRIVLLGDVLHRGWIPSEGRRRIPRLHLPVMRALARAAARGVLVTWVLGNHELNLQWAMSAIPGGQASERWEATIHGHRVLAIHGDQADWTTRYAVVRGALRSRAMNRGLEALDRLHLAYGVLSLVARAPCGPGRPTGDLAVGIRQLAAGELAAGFSLVLAGHSHTPALERVDGGLYANPGTFRDGRRHLVVDAAGGDVHISLVGSGGHIEASELL